ncbi:MAG: hypothetical protein H6747_07985 [Deltaproteobacteria bacterium]|nr:hypothetical protein [Deltaproteobacteria bacterium]
MNESKLHMIAFSETWTGFPSDYEALLAVPDGIFALAGTEQLYVPAGMRLIVAYALAETFETPRFRVHAASLLKVAYPSITPIQSANASGGDPNVQDLRDMPVVFNRDEALGVDFCASSGAATGTQRALLMFAENIEPVPEGDAFWIRGSDATTTPTADRWSTLAALTWENDPLPEGIYAIIGFVHIGPQGAVGARLVLVGRSHRPGTISVESSTERTHRIFYEGSLGVMGTFTAYAPPNIEVFGPADTGHEVYLRVIRIG